MFLRLVDKDGFKSPILYIHSDEDEFMEQIREWKNELHRFIEDENKAKEVGGPNAGGIMPLTRLDPETCLVDLVRHLSLYYTRTTPHSKGHVTGCLRLVDYNPILKKVKIEEINLHE